MAKEKATDAVIAESLSADEEKQMATMRASDSAPVDDAPQPEKLIEPNPKVEPKPEADDSKKNTMVPHAAMEAERQRRKAAEKGREEQALENARLAERVNLINQALEGRGRQEQQKPLEYMEVPDPEKDAMGAVKALLHNQKVTAEENKAFSDFRKQNENRQRAADQINEVSSRAVTLEKEFMAKTPDYKEASDFLKQSRFVELQAFGLDPQQANEQIVRETFELAVQATKMQKNPAEIVYNFAKARGYAAKAPATGETEAEKLTRIAEGQKANQTLTSIPGAAPGSGKIDAKSLSAMPEEDFAKMLKSLTPTQRHELFGS